MKSIERQSQVIGVHINGIRDKSGQVLPAGPNPSEYLGLLTSADGCSGTPTVWDGSHWVYYTDLGQFRIREQAMSMRGKNLQLSAWLPIYAWTDADGFSNDRVTADTAKVLRHRLATSRCLFYATTANGSKSKWMPSAVVFAPSGVAR